MTDQRESEFRSLYQEQFGFVYRLCVRMIGPHSPDIEDLVQEVFMVAYRKFDTFDGICKPSTWLYGICWRVVAQYGRRKKLEQVFKRSENDQRVEEGTSTTTPEDTLRERQMTDLFYRVLDQLSFKKRQVLVLYELEGHSGTEIAEMVGCKVATVWTRLHKARKDFQTRWRKHSLMNVSLVVDRAKELPKEVAL